MATKNPAAPPADAGPPDLGLALSGGGFRAAAFHLGVLKRLREIGLLGHVKFLSTVSGGSITGAYWARWQAGRDAARDALTNDASWNAFESSLVDFMRRGIRGRIMVRGFLLPFLLGAVPAAFAIWWFLSPLPRLTDTGWLWVAGAGMVCGLLVGFRRWHRKSADLLEAQYRKLFGDFQVKDLKPGSGCPRPELCINATGLKAGEHLVFKPGARRRGVKKEKWSALLKDIGQLLTSGKPGAKSSGGKSGFPKIFSFLATSFLASLGRDRGPVLMQDAVPLARAVAASSAFPPVFPALRLKQDSGEHPWWGTYLRALWREDDGIAYAIDGGVYDNQGSQFLVEHKCRHIIVSDAALVLREDPAPSTWQLFSWKMLKGKRGALLRVSDIYQERARDLGYKRLRALTAVGKALADAERYMDPREYPAYQRKFSATTPYVSGFSYIELKPAGSFRWRAKRARHGDEIIDALAQVRTDLNGFTATELSALMFHGYTLIDHCLRSYRPGWLPNPGRPPPLAFRSSVGDLNAIDWDGLPGDGERFRETLRHLQAARSRFWLWRFLRRRG